MTADEFNAEYRLGQCLTSDGIRSTLAQEARKGRLVLVHELSTGSPPEQRRVEILLRQLAPGDAAQVIGSYEVDGAPVVVTKFLLGFTSLLAWLEACVAQSQTRVIDTRDNPPTMDMAIHDPERYRRRPPEPIVAPALEDTSVRPVVPARPAPSTPDAQPAAPPLTVAASTPEADVPTGSFTQLFGKPTAAPPAADPPQQAAASPSDGPGGPGAFTQLFGAGDASPEPGPAPVAEAVPRPAAPAPIDTSPFHTPPIGPPATPASVEEPSTGDFTRLFGGRAAPAPTPPPQAPPLRAPRSEPVAAAAPPVPAPRRDPAVAVPFDDDAPAPAALGPGPGAPPPPRVRLDALSNPPSLDPAATSRRESDLASGGLSSQPPVPFSTPGPIGGSASTGGIAPPPLAAPERPSPGYRAPAVPPSAPVASPAGGGYTEVLTPARPPLTPAPPRLPTPAAGAPPPPRPSFVPLLVGLLVFGVLAVAVVVGFVMTSS